ncbi:hypothetical protein [Actinokineospora spheciospongiae]|uniref:hypothetical protein n=1 Tax=Actinokineospora spheciospongiae TaxID=909613 RepID=UPI000D71327B|nr:hypothetical protein [Actinokineospora spheciospongiae]PWW57045.1 hypothetical protein DFQ13_110247 [Actinokineospora spheciospongiae]
MRIALLRLATVAASAVAALALGTGFASATGGEHDPVSTPADAPISIQVTKLSQSDAAARFRSSGITWSSSGGCTNRQNSTCTSFEQINLTTVQGGQTFKSASGCAVNITGGTEVGHASGTYSHYNGYKIDISLSSCVTGYIQRNFTAIGGNQWRSGSGNIYYLESNHWDITYYNCGGC